MVTFLAMNGIEVAAEPDEAVEFMTLIAAGGIDTADAAVWIAAHSDHEPA